MPLRQSVQPCTTDGHNPDVGAYPAAEVVLLHIPPVSLTRQVLQLFYVLGLQTCVGFAGGDVKLQAGIQLGQCPFPHCVTSGLILPVLKLVIVMHIFGNVEG